MPRILVTGATGTVGRHVVDASLDRGASVRALTRRPGRARLATGVELVEGDLTDAGSLKDAAKGVDAVFLLWPSFDPTGADRAVGVLASQARKIVYLSATSAEHGGVWGAVEQAVERSGAARTFLRAGGFAKNTLEWAGQIRAGDVVRVPYPGAGRSLIHERDIAAVAVRALLDEGHDGQKYVLTGPSVVTTADQVRLIGEAIGRPLRAVAQPIDEARAELRETFGDGADGALAYWASLVEHPEPVTPAVEEVTGTPARSFEEWAGDHAADFHS
jgi:uncharacterized protein YbjT (DUF2867 family)